MRKSKKNWGKTALYAFVAFDCVGIYAAYQKVNQPVDTTASIPQIAAVDMAVPPIAGSDPQFHGESAPAARGDERLALNTAPTATLTAAVPQAHEQPALALVAAPAASKPMQKAAQMTAPRITAPSFVAPAAHALAVKAAPRAAAPAVTTPPRAAAPHFAVSEAPRGKSLVALAAGPAAKPTAKAAGPAAKPTTKAAKAPASLASLAGAAHNAHAKRDARLFAKAFDQAFGPVGQNAPLLEAPVPGGVNAQAYAEPAAVDATAAMAAVAQPATPSVAPAAVAPASPAGAPVASTELPPA